MGDHVVFILELLATQWALLPLLVAVFVHVANVQRLGLVLGPTDGALVEAVPSVVLLHVGTQRRQVLVLPRAVLTLPHGLVLGSLLGWTNMSLEPLGYII